MADILVIDDDRAILATIDILLKKAGHTVTTASDGRVGIQLSRTRPFDLLIVDIFMPNMDGLETLAEVHKVDPDLPVIVISGYQVGSSQGARPDFLHMATRLGAVTGLSKPFRPAELIAAVSASLEKRRLSSGDPPARPASGSE